ncbi:DinB family protein [Dictyobacter aurantiacus]|nr:DinB family protein [Dictyobacter aurantiacus]
MLANVIELKSRLLLSLYPMPENVAGHIRAAHAYTQVRLQRLPQYDPVREVFADDEHSYTPRKVLRRILDHALDHLNQLEQWLNWQQKGIEPRPTNGWASSAVTLDEDLLPLTAKDLDAWLWRIDLVVEMLIQRTENLSLQQLDWIPQDEGWSIKQTLHHLAAAEMFYAFWLDADLPEHLPSRYLAVSQMFDQQLQTLISLPDNEKKALYDANEMRFTTPEAIIQKVLLAESQLLRG